MHRILLRFLLEVEGGRSTPIEAEGTCDLVFLTPEGYQETSIMVSKGKAEIDLDSLTNAGRIHLAEIYITRSDLSPPLEDTILIPCAIPVDSSDFVVHLQRDESTILDVIDGESTFPIPLVQVWTSGRSSWEAVHATAPPSLEGAVWLTTPFSMTGRRVGRRVWIGAPGYAWSAFDLNPHRQERVRVELYRSASLRLINLSDAEAHFHIQRVVAPKGAESIAVLSLQSGQTMSLDPLPGGQYFAVASTSGGHLLLSSRSFHLRPGQAETLTIPEGSSLDRRFIELEGNEVESLLGTIVKAANGEMCFIESQEGRVGFYLPGAPAYTGQAIPFFIGDSKTIHIAREGTPGGEFSSPVRDSVLVGVHLLDNGAPLVVGPVQVVSIAEQGVLLVEVAPILRDAIQLVNAHDGGGLVEGVLRGQITVFASTKHGFILENSTIDSIEPEIIFPDSVHPSITLISPDPTILGSGWQSEVHIEGENGALQPLDITFTPVSESPPTVRIQCLTTPRRIFLPSLQGASIGGWRSLEVGLGPDAEQTIHLGF